MAALQSPDSGLGNFARPIARLQSEMDGPQHTKSETVRSPVQSTQPETEEVVSHWLIDNAAAWEGSESPVSKQRVDGKRAGKIFAVEATCVQVRYMTCIEVAQTRQAELGAGRVAGTRDHWPRSDVTPSSPLQRLQGWPAWKCERWRGQWSSSGRDSGGCAPEPLSLSRLSCRARASPYKAEKADGVADGRSHSDCWQCWLRGRLFSNPEGIATRYSLFVRYSLPALRL